MQHCWCDTTAITEPHCGAFLGFGKQQGGNRHSMAAEKENGLGKVQDPEIAEHDKAADLLRIQQVEPGFHSKSNVPESSSSHFHIWSWAILWNPLTLFAQDQGLGLHELTVLAATLEHLIHDEADSNILAQVLLLVLVNGVHAVQRLFMAVFVV